LTKAYLVAAYLHGADLRWADLTQANLHKANLTKANLVAANLTKAYLGRADLDGADLTGANLTQAIVILSGTPTFSVKSANLSGAVIGGDWSHVNMENTIWEGARYEPGTKFPEGFTPALVGLKPKKY
jgi:uncharacterized protein YjbI with pentapeptide repeats